MSQLYCHMAGEPHYDQSGTSCPYPIEERTAASGKFNYVKCRKCNYYAKLDQAGQRVISSEDWTPFKYQKKDDGSRSAVSSFTPMPADNQEIQIQLDRIEKGLFDLKDRTEELHKVIAKILTAVTK